VQAQTATATAALSQAAGGAPPGLQGFMSDAAKGGSAAQTSAAEGAVTQTYAADILPSCQTAAQDKYPFFGASQIDVTTIDAIKTFGPGGTLDAFMQQRLMPMLDTSGPVWRWKADDPVASAVNPTTADDLSRVAQIRDMLTTGLTFKVSPESLGPDVDAVEFSSGGATYRFDATNKDPQPVVWTVQGLPAAHVTLFKGGQVVQKFDGDGPWAIFRVMDAASARQNAGTSAFLATFGQGTKAATLRIALSSAFNPFSKGGVWTFRCPVTL
jgi:type VI secretion system protein ImpL